MGAYIDGSLRTGENIRHEAHLSLSKWGSGLHPRWRSVRIRCAKRAAMPCTKQGGQLRVSPKC